MNWVPKLILFVGLLDYLNLPFVEFLDTAYPIDAWNWIVLYFVACFIFDD